MLPVYMSVFVWVCFICLFMSWVIAASSEDGVKSHQLGRGAVGFSWNLSFSVAPPTCRKHNLLRLGCKNKNENTVTHRTVVISWGEREAVVAWFECDGVCGFSLTDFSAVLLKRIVIPHTMTWLCPLTEGGKKEKAKTGLRYVLHSATQSLPRSRLCSVTVRQTPYTPPPPRCPLKGRGCGWIVKLPTVQGNQI